MVAEKKMKVDITGSNLQEFLGLAQNFPNGKVVVEQERAYWEWAVQQITQVSPTAPIQPQMQPQRGPQKNAFLKMFDSMADYF